VIVVERIAVVVVVEVEEKIVLVKNQLKLKRQTKVIQVIMIVVCLRFLERENLIAEAVLEGIF
jgi:hypothetical protein